MATVVKVFEGTIDPATAIEVGIQDILDNEAPAALSDMIILGYGGGDNKGVIVIYDDGA